MAGGLAGGTGGLNAPPRGQRPFMAIIPIRAKITQGEVLLKKSIAIGILICAMAPSAVLSQGRNQANIGIPQTLNLGTAPTPSSQSSPEICNDGVDNDMDGYTDQADPDCSQSDTDGDGFLSTSVGGTDCDDQDPEIFPGAVEVMDGIDNNCNNSVDEGSSPNTTVSTTTTAGVSNATASTGSYAVTPGLGTIGSLSVGSTSVGSTSVGATSAGSTSVGGTSVGVGTSTTATSSTSTSNSSNSTSYGSNPGGSPEICTDGVDNDLDGDTDLADSDCADSDADGDGFLSISSGGLDCDDTDPAAHPGAPDLANDGTDWNCDGND